MYMYATTVWLIMKHCVYILICIYTAWATKKQPAIRFARVLVIFSLALVCILRRVLLCIDAGCNHFNP